MPHQNNYFLHLLAFFCHFYFVTLIILYADMMTCKNTDLECIFIYLCIGCTISICLFIGHHIFTVLVIKQYPFCR